ncbi:MAG: polysaccharide lyase 6 family protein [Armatimonadota bacterium]
MRLILLLPYHVLLVSTLSAVLYSGLGSFPACAAEILVRTTNETTSALNAARPGDTITLENGDYDLGRVTITRGGTAAAPVTIRPRQGQEGKVRLVGKTGFVFRRTGHVTLRGFDFATEEVPPVEITGSHHVRITENRFRIKEPEGKGTFRWVRLNSTRAEEGQPAINSHHNRIDHCLFEEKHTIGNFISVDGNSLPYPKAQISQYDRIDHNHFRNIGPRVPNGMEAIRVGLAGLSLSSGFTVIEDNLFENCDGDPEVISIKTSDATIRNNTFRACEGGLCLRHGNRNRASGNRFFGEGKKGSNGIRMYGDDHRIEDNYFTGLTSFALAVTNGSADYGADYTKGEKLPVGEPDQLLRLHLRPRRITLRKNTIVDCAEAILLGAPYGLPLPQKPPQDLLFEKNTIFAGKKTEAGKDAKLVEIRTPPERITWRGNTVFAGEFADIGLPGGVTEAQVRVVRGTGTAPAAPRPSSDVGPGWLRARLTQSTS